MRLRRRVADLEARIEALECELPIDYTMPARYDIDIPPRAAVAELQPYDGPPLDDGDESWTTPTGTGMYL